MQTTTTQEVVRTLNFETAPRLKYQPRDHKKEVRLNIHVGQRKLLLSEIEFLTFYGHLSNTVIYAGAAGGTHIHYLSVLFPDHEFHCWDPAPFRLERTPRIHLYNEYFTKHTAKQIAEKYPKGVLFIGDIRTNATDLKDGDDGKWDPEIMINMRDQELWISIMKPLMSMIKFRLPYEPGQTEYLDGQIRFQCWAPLNSTETRLITNGSVTRKYDHTQYEEIMYHFNKVTRGNWFEYPTVLQGPQITGLDHCYDCVAEMYILLQYTILRGLPPAIC